jgi:hypothetical protein
MTILQKTISGVAVVAAKWVLVAAVALAFALPAAAAGEMTSDAGKLAVRWADALLALRVDGTGRPELDGGLMCPACGGMHGRAADAVWPLFWLWDKTGDERYLNAAKGLVAWARHNCERPDGAYVNGPNLTWRGTTSFIQAAIGRVLLRYGDRLDEATRAEWRGMFDRQTAWLHKWMDDPATSVNVNYHAGFALSMEIAYAVDGNAAHRTSGDRAAKRVLACIADDGLLFGEMNPMDRTTARGCRGVDVGYNMEETLPSMLEWAERRGDSAALDRIVRCGEAHLAFVLPDGAIDNSFGSRAYKWTYWGSRTSDGALPLYIALARRGVPGAQKAAQTTLALYRRCTDPASGLLMGGLCQAAAGEPPCVHHTFCHLKTLPETVEELKPSGELTALPCDSPFGLKRFTTTDVAIARVGPWRATASASDAYLREGANLAADGGSLTLLWHSDVGPVFASSIAKWKIVEKMNMQEQRHDDVTRSFTPRLETADGEYRSVYDDKVAFLSEQLDDGSVRFGAKGTLRNGDRKAAENAGFSLDWTVSMDGVKAVAKCDRAATFVVPVLVLPGDSVSVEGRVAKVVKTGGTIELKASRDFVQVRTTRPDGLAFSPQTGFLAAYLTLQVLPGETTDLMISHSR